MKSILRGDDIYGRGNLIPVGRSKFFEDYVEHDESDPYVLGTDGKVLRLKAFPLGERAIGFLRDKVEELIEALSQLRNDPSRKVETDGGARSQH